MSVFIKLNETDYIEWSKASDSPASNILNKEEVIEAITENFRVVYLLKDLTPFSDKFNTEVSSLLAHLETYGTTDVTQVVDLGFILKYNRAGDFETYLDLNGIIAKYRKN